MTVDKLLYMQVFLSFDRQGGFHTSTPRHDLLNYPPKRGEYTMRLFDAHCHLQSSDAFERSAALGIAGMAVCGTSPDDWADCIGAHKKFQGLENPPVIFPML